MMRTFESTRTRIVGFTRIAGIVRDAGFGCVAEFAHAAGRVRTTAIVLGAILGGAAAVPESIAAQDFQWRGRLEAVRAFFVRADRRGTARRDRPRRNDSYSRSSFASFTSLL